MIGGYIFQFKDKKITGLLDNILVKSYNRISCRNIGFLFYDSPFSDLRTNFFASDKLTFLSQDLLVTYDSGGEYVLLDPQKDLSQLFLSKKTEAFNEIVSDYRLIVMEQSKDTTNLYLVSNRAGNGRMYYHKLESGILFSSDLRFLLKMIPFNVDEVAVYSVLKYGAIPEPMTISKDIEAVPPAHYLHFDVRNGSFQTNVYFKFDFPCETRRDFSDNLDAIIQPARDKLRQSAKLLGKHKPAILISGGIDSSLYALYLNQFSNDRISGVHCTFGDKDPEFSYAQLLTEKINIDFHVGRMEGEDALTILNDTVSLTGHPFADFSSMPIVFILKFIKNKVKDTQILIEGNGGDDCFGFPDLTTQSKWEIKSRFPKIAKNIIASLYKGSNSWKWESHEGLFGRVLALSDVHEINPINYYLVLTPINFLGLNTYPEWDIKLSQIMDDVFSKCVDEHDKLSYEAKVTIRQLLHVNSRRWAAKAYSVGESLGIRIIYPYIWRDILIEQGNIPWQAKVNKGIVKWPLKRLLEEYMPKEFIYRKKSGFVPPFVRWLTSSNFNHIARGILLAPNGIMGQIVSPKVFDELLTDALKGKNLRHAVLNFLWGALFTEMWIKKYKNSVH